MRSERTEKAATLDDIARRAGVAKSTVSGAFTGKKNMAPETREMILRIAEELKFVPNPHAQRLSQGRCNDTIGLFVLDLNLGTGVRKAQLIQSAFIERGYEVPLYGYSIYNYDEGGRRQIKAMKTLCRQRPRAIVCNTSALHPGALDELRNYLDDGGIVVLYDEAVEIDCDHVLFDRAENIYQGVHHLVELGHRTIGLAGSNPTLAWNPRLAGYWRALREFGLVEREEWVFLDLPSYEEGGAQLAERFTALEERPTAMCIVNDWMAATFVLEAQRRGVRVPDDISVVSLDNMPAAGYAAVPLTSVSQPIQGISEAVVELVMSRLEGRHNGESRQIVLRGDLVIRKSTAPVSVQKEVAAGV
jgi:LacI family repressor for deo operon, udp, cdd, tsx, nupC, and nupG